MGHCRRMQLAVSHYVMYRYRAMHVILFICVFISELSNINTQSGHFVQRPSTPIVVLKMGYRLLHNFREVACV